MTLFLIAASPTVVAQTSARQRFPLQAVEQRAGTGLRLTGMSERFVELENRSSVRLEAVPLPDRPTVDLQLRRVRLLRDDAILAVNGVQTRAADLAPAVSLWTGKVVGDPDSFVFFAFSPFGSRGVIRHERELYRMRAEAGRDGDWTESSSYMLGPADAPMAASAVTCGSSDIEQLMEIPASMLPPNAPSMGFAPGVGDTPSTIYQANIAVETDYQFYQKFGDLEAAQTYALTVLGAASAIYEEQCKTVFNVPYLGIHTQSNDPWDAQDSGGGTSGVLYEFRDAWSYGKAPVSADLYHFLSGASLGGGIAYINALCSQGYGFGVSGNISGSLTVPIPAGVSPWDLVVVAHELGHNFSSPHTHSFCPPLDECAPSSYFGSCQDEQLCIPNGTIMSYCHLCSGGLSNIDLQFHTTVAETIRNAVEFSCLQPALSSYSLSVDRPEGIAVEVDPLLATSTQEILSIGNITEPLANVDWSTSILEVAAWLQASPTSGTVGATPDDVTLTFDATGLDPGTYTATLRVQNVAEPLEKIDVPISLRVIPPPILLGDRITGEISSASDDDQVRFEAFAGLTLKLVIDRTEGTAPARIEVFDPAGDEVDSWSVGAGKLVKKEVKLLSTGWFVLRVTGKGEAAGAFNIKTRAKLPGAAQKRVKKKVKASPGTNFADVTVKAFTGATLKVVIKPKTEIAGTLSSMLFDPADEAVDVSGYLGSNGLSFSGVSLTDCGAFRVRISGFSSTDEYVRVVTEPIQPLGTATIAID